MTRSRPLGEKLIGIAAILAVGAGLYLFFSPVEIHSITATTPADGLGTVQEAITTQSWFQVQGWWGIMILFLFAALYLGAYQLARRRAYVWLGMAALGLVLLSYLSGFSIGLLYLPAALALLAGTVMLLFGQDQKQGTS